MVVWPSDQGFEVLKGPLFSMTGVGTLRMHLKRADSAWACATDKKSADDPIDETKLLMQSLSDN